MPELDANVPSPGYEAVMTWWPAGSAKATKVATPAKGDADPRVPDSSEKPTASPSGMGPYVEVMAAVRVTDCPTNEGEPEVDTLIAVFARTDSVSSGERLYS